jgi:hypothetical protein
MQDGGRVLIVSDKLARALADRKEPGSQLGIVRGFKASIVKSSAS